EAAARGVLLVLTDRRPEWQEAIAAWDAPRIRKGGRRARGAEWHRAEALDGLTVLQGSAGGRVFPPIPLDAWPRDLTRLQVGGTDLTDPRPPPPVSDVPLMLLSPHYEMTAGKAMAQAAHAAQLGWRSMSDTSRAAWQAASFPLAVRVATPAPWGRGFRGGGARVPAARRTARER